MKRSFTRLRSMIFLPVMAILFIGALSFAKERQTPPASDFLPDKGLHLDHSGYFSKPFKSGPDVTKACLKCHEEAGREFLKTAHWKWTGEPVQVPGHGKAPIRIGKKNLINNYCISIQGNWPSCTKCHAGYGWEDETFDFDNPENIDCLVCHDRSGQYAKGKKGLPTENVDLQASAKSVGKPSRDNCGACHFFGGGGMGVKHGDLNDVLTNPEPSADVHMGANGMSCTDCHRTEHHNIKGRSIAVSVDTADKIACTDCHKGSLHADARLNDHMDTVACQTCHIPTFAERAPTKIDWDWSKAGDDKRIENPHEYLKIKGEFVYGQSVVPEYRWFNGMAGRYLLGDRIDPEKVTEFNPPLGSIEDPKAKIFPFKIHTGKQPYDVKNRYFIPPVTAGEGGFWKEFDWAKAIRLGAKQAKLPYSGEYGFAPTDMYWPLNHSVPPKKKALECTDCHGENGRMDWKRLGYPGDPIVTGGR